MTLKPTVTLQERAARALCRKAGYSEDMMFDGKPAWAWYLDQANAVLKAVEPAKPHADHDHEHGAGI